MKQYPSIPRSTGQDFREFQAHVFDKLDGSNLRFEWSRKSGWYKTGSRKRLFDETDEVFTEALAVFETTWSEPLARVFRDQRWERAVAFLEFWGASSFAGLHVPGEPKTLTLFDVAPFKQGILGPQPFRKLFGGFEHTPRYLGLVNWTRGFVERVRNGEVEGITFEGVVGKAGEGHKQIRSKAKTQAWIDQVLARYGEERGRKIVES